MTVEMTQREPVHFVRASWVVTADLLFAFVQPAKFCKEHMPIERFPIMLPRNSATRVARFFKTSLIIGFLFLSRNQIVFQCTYNKCPFD
jgi:hypothetical protein